MRIRTGCDGYKGKRRDGEVRKAENRRKTGWSSMLLTFLSTQLSLSCGSKLLQPTHIPLGVQAMLDDLSGSDNLITQRRGFILSLLTP